MSVERPCPLPVDWLDYLEDGERNQRLSCHLRRCASCQAAVDLIRPGTGKPLRHDLALLRRGLCPFIAVEPQPAGVVPEVGEIWLTRSSFSEDGYSYRELERSLLLLLWPQPWLPGAIACAPIDTDTWNATEIDLLLTAAQTTLAVPFRVVFAWQGTVAPSQLESRVGSLTDPGLLEHVLVNDLPDSDWGLPLGGPDDERLRHRDRFGALLQPLYGFSWRKLADDD